MYWQLAHTKYNAISVMNHKNYIGKTRRDLNLGNELKLSHTHLTPKDKKCMNKNRLNIKLNQSTQSETR